MIKFMHTADWQLGMTRYFFSEGTQERYNQARFDAIRTMGRIAKEEGCLFILVCGDAFESNQVDRKTVVRTLEALKDVPVPVFIIPGNHDPLNAASVYRSSTFERKPDNVRVIESADPIKINDDLEIVGAPWMSKKPAVNPLEEVLGTLETIDGITRICAAHGVVDYFTPDRDAPAVIAVELLEQAIKDRKVDFIALGDRHSLTRLGGTDRIWYSGTPEATDFAEVQSGFANIVEIDDGMVSAKPVQIGKWQFIDKGRFDLNTPEEMQSLRKFFDDIANKECTVVRVNCVGSLSLALREELQEDLDTAKDVFAACDVCEDDLVLLPDDTDFNDLGFSGFAKSSVEQLRTRIAEGGPESMIARDALMLLKRLARGSI